ncbi:MAG TPA: ATP-binding protein [Vicinamibacterales bacterium]|nr:ATP-binding protein [Vicinamibacterales bacterium]
MPPFLRWSRLRLRTKGLIVVGLPVLPLAVFWLVVVLAVFRQSPPANSPGRTLIIQAGLARVFSDLLDGDAASRHNLFTDSAAALQRYRNAVDRLPADMAVLDNAVIDPSLRDSLAELKATVEDELTTLARLVEGQKPGAPKLSEVAALDRSVTNLERVRSISASIEKGQGALTSARTDQMRKTQRAWFYGLLAASVVCGAGGIIAALMLANGVSRRAAALSRNADRLAHGLPPEPLPVGEDEISVVDARLREAARLLRVREDELQHRTKQLEEANKELEAFSYSVSHDLRAPLRAIDGFSEAILHDCADRLDEGGKDSLRRVRAAATRMGVLIDELLNLSRLNRIEVQRQHVDIAGSANAIVADLARRTPSRTVDVTIAPGLDANADPELVQIALHNLLDNAWKYTGKTPSAHIEVGVTPNGVAKVFHVRDNGAGFEMAYANRLFGAFQRLHGDRDFEGTGIGLAIVQRIVHRHGGRIWAESAVNAGATFYFTLEPERVGPA